MSMSEEDVVYTLANEAAERDFYTFAPLPIVPYIVTEIVVIARCFRQPSDA